MDSKKVDTVHSGLNLEKKSFSWNIGDFDIIKENDELTSSQMFYFHAGNGIGLPSKWKFYLHPSTQKLGKDEKRLVGLYLKLERKPRDVTQVIASFKATIKKNDGSNYYANEMGFKTFEQHGKSNSWGLSNALSQNALLEELPLNEGCLQVELEFTMCVPKDQTVLEDTVEL